MLYKSLVNSAEFNPPLGSMSPERGRSLWSESAPQRRAFTLIELLVVIAIIGILASLLVPAIARAKEEGRRAVCIGNFRQLHIAWHLYIDDNNGHLPWNDGTVTTSLGMGPPSWVGGDMTYMDDWRDNTNTVLLLRPDEGTIGRYLNDAKIFKCPSDRSTAKFSGIPRPRVRSVAMNHYMGTEVGADPNGMNPNGWYYRMIDQLISHPPLEQGAVFIDTHEDSIATGLFLVERPPGAWWDHFPASRHNGAATISFSDGHVICHKWRDERTRIPVIGKSVYGVNYGVKQIGNPDIRWLQERATAPRNPSGF